eukprot:2897773-Amphidinium_carterae.1
MPPYGPACVPGPKGHDTKAKTEKRTHTHLGKDNKLSLLPQWKKGYRSTSRHSAVGRLNAVLLLIHC